MGLTSFSYTNFQLSGFSILELFFFNSKLWGEIWPLDRLTTLGQMELIHPSCKKKPPKSQSYSGKDEEGNEEIYSTASMQNEHKSPLVLERKITKISSIKGYICLSNFPGFWTVAPEDIVTVKRAYWKNDLLFWREIWTINSNKNSSQFRQFVTQLIKSWKHSLRCRIE